MNRLPRRPPQTVYPPEQTELNIAANRASWRAKYLDAAIGGIAQQLLRCDANCHAERIVAELVMDELFCQRLSAREEEQEFRRKWREFQTDTPAKPV